MDTDEKSLRRWRDTHAPAADGQQDEELAKYRQKRPEEQAKCELPFLAVPAAGNDDVSEPNTCDHQEEAGESSGDRAETTRPRTGEKTGDGDQSTESKHCKVADYHQISNAQRYVHEPSISMPRQITKLKKMRAAFSKMMQPAPVRPRRRARSDAPYRLIIFPYPCPSVFIRG